MRLSFRLSDIAGLLMAASLLPIIACTPPELAEQNKKSAGINLDLRNLQVEKIYNLRDARKRDSLLQYFASEDATLRYLAALSFASMPDTAAIGPLTPLLRDNVEDVRMPPLFRWARSVPGNAKNR